MPPSKYREVIVTQSQLIYQNQKTNFFRPCFIPRNSRHFPVKIFLKKIIKIIWLRTHIHLGKTHPKLSKCSIVINLEGKKKTKEEVNEVFIRDVIPKNAQWDCEWTLAEPVLPSKTHWGVFGGWCKPHGGWSASLLWSVLSCGCPHGHGGQLSSSLSKHKIRRINSRP